MYKVFYLFRVPIRNTDRFIRINSAAAEIYRRYGADSNPVARLTDGKDKYGCLGLSDLIQADPEEEIFIGIDSFQDVQRFHTQMKQIDSDPDIGRLYKEIQEVVDLKRIVRWEMEEAE